VELNGKGRRFAGDPSQWAGFDERNVLRAAEHGDGQPLR
jgi:hypothetical protein